MKRVVVVSIKGGVGKTTIWAQVGLNLIERGYKVGFLDIDTGAPNGHLALGLDDPPPLSLDTEHSQIIPSRINGYELVTLASHWGEGRILWRGADKANIARQLLEGAIAWGDLDYLIYDTPPSMSEENLALFDYIIDAHGFIIVTQPTDFSVADTERLIDTLRNKKLPIIGIVANFDGVLCPHCGHTFHPFLTKSVDIRAFALEHKLPFLVGIPQAGIETVKPLFAQLTQEIIDTKPIILPSGEKRKALKREIVMKMFGKE